LFYADIDPPSQITGLTVEPLTHPSAPGVDCNTFVCGYAWGLVTVLVLVVIYLILDFEKS
jgi:hypothetical protein